MDKVTDEMRTKWRKRLSTIAEAREIGALSLSDWETEFIDSIEIQISNDRDLSFKQSSILGRIYAKVQ